MFGWFGFNAGSALSANGQAAHAFMTTAVSAAAALLSWMLCDVIKNKKPTLIGACTGMVAGLVGITPGAGFVPILGSCNNRSYYKPCLLPYDIFWKRKSSHLMMHLMLSAVMEQAVSVGRLLTGIFAKESIGGYDGAIFGDWAQFGAQAAGIAITIVIAVAGTLICYGITRLVTGKIRVNAKDEMLGLDITQHGESAYPSFNGLE